MSESTCPICGSSEFIDFNTRSKVQCASCRSLERTRLMWMILKKLNVVGVPKRVMHVAPEMALMRRLKSICGDHYYPCDIDTKKYNNALSSIFPVDLCVDVYKYPSKCFDLIIHNHVLEHLPCNITPVLHQMHRILDENGLHLFSVPFRGAKTEEDLSPSLSAEERTRRFAQFDHMRIFGVDDFPKYLDNEFGGELRLFPLADYFSEEDMRIAAIPLNVLSGISGHSFFFFQKQS